MDENTVRPINGVNDNQTDIGAGSGDATPQPEEEDFLKGKKACDPKNFKDCESCQ